MQNDDFEWDDDKAALNLQRHDVSFEIACWAFRDAFADEREDTRASYSEVRYNLVGIVQGRLLHVTYTLRNDRIRIISARPADSRERKRYHEHNAKE